MHTKAQQARMAKAESASRTRPEPARARVVAPFTPRVGRPLPPTTRERMEASFELEHSHGHDDADPAAVDEPSAGAESAAKVAAAKDDAVVMDEPAAGEPEAGVTDAAALTAANVTLPAPAATLGATAHRPAAEAAQLDERQTVRREAAGDARWTTRSRILGRARAVASAGDAAGAVAPAHVARAAPEVAAEVAPRPEAAEAVTVIGPTSRPGEGAAAPVEPEVKPDAELKLGLELEQGAAPAVAPGGTRRRGGARLTVAGGSGGPGGDPGASGAWREPLRALIRVDAAPPTTDETGAPPRRVEAHARGPPTSEETQPKTTPAAGDDTALDDLHADPGLRADDLRGDPTDLPRNHADLWADGVRAGRADDLRAQPAIRASKPLAALSPTPVIQAKLAVSSPGDSLELEADAVAARVLGGATPRPPAASVIAGSPARVAPRQRGPPTEGCPASVRAALQTGGGRSLDPALRARIEPHIGVDLSHVRVRQEPAAAAAAHDLHARAFTSGSTIFLAAESSPTDVALMAHEATHVAQQQTVPAARTTLMRDVTDYLPDVSVSDVIPDWILDGVRSAVRAIPGYTLLTYITGNDPLTDEPVAVSHEELIETLLTYGPFGAAVGTVLQSIDVLGEIFDFVSEGLATHDLTLARLKRDIGDAWDELSVTNGIAGNVAIVERYVNALLRDVGSFVESIVDRVLEVVRSVVAEVAEPLLETPEIAPVWNLAKKVLHYDPLRGVEVQAETVEIIADFLRLIGQEQRLAQMEERGTLQETADWLDTQLGTFASLVSELGTLFSDAWAAIQPQNLPDLFTNLAALAQRAFGFVQRVGEFAATVIVKILELIKDALLGWLSEHAHQVPGFHLLTVILGQNPFTGEQVLRTAENLIKGFITLLPGGEATYEQLAESGVIGSAAERIEGEMARLGISLELITGIFLGIWDTLTLDDLLDPIGAFGRILDLFGEPLSRLVEFVGVVIEVVITLVLRLMNFPSDLLGSIIANALQAIEDIKRDPVAFVKNMLRAVVLGFSGFFDNILTYLTQGLTAWLFRGLGQLGITIPSDFTLQSILTLVVQVLGITVDTLWTKLGKHIGEERVAMIRGAIDRLSGAWAFIKDVQEGGIAAVWRYVTDQLSGLWDTLIGMAKDWIMTTIIGRVTTKLLTMLDPTGVMAVVNSFIAFFAAVQSAIEYLRDILEIVNRYVTTLAQVAAGNIVPGAQMLEQGLASAIPVAIGFLANQVGLGNVPEKIVEIIGGLRELVDEALDWLIGQAVRLGTAALRSIAQAGLPQDPGERLRLGMDAAEAAVNRFAGRRVGAVVLNPLLAAIRIRYGFQTLSVVPENSRWAIVGEVNPPAKRVTRVLAGTGTGTGADAFQYEISGVGTLGETFEPEKGGKLGPTPPKKLARAYIGETPTRLAGAPPSTIATKYLKAFSLPEEAEQRFSLVIGVNAHDDLAEKNKTKIKNSPLGAGQAYPWGVLKFLWVPRWTDTASGTPAPLLDVRQAFNELPPDLQAGVSESKDKAKGVPLGEIRTLIHTSQERIDFHTALSERAETVYAHVSDEDTVNFNPRTEGGEEPQALFARFDSALVEIERDIQSQRAEGRASDGGQPIIATGGYEFELHTPGKPVEGQTPDLRVHLAGRLDMAVRRAMASVDPRSVYFPEPNLLIELTPDTITASFGTGTLQSRQLVKFLREHRPRLVYTSAALATGTTPKRFAINDGRAVSSWAQLQELKPEDIVRMLNIEQSHANKTGWVHQVAASYGINRFPSLFELWDAFFPVSERLWDRKSEGAVDTLMELVRPGQLEKHASYGDPGDKIQSDLQGAIETKHGRTQAEPEMLSVIIVLLAIEGGLALARELNAIFERMKGA